MPKAMLAATPPRRTTRSSTRNDSDTLCSWSGSSCSANRPGKCIRWSVAIEPVTAIFIASLRGSVLGGWGAHSLPPTADGRSRPGGNGRSRCPSGDSVEGVAARAGALRVGVVDGEALGVDAVREVDGGAAQVGRAHPVDDDLDGPLGRRELAHLVAVE